MWHVLGVSGIVQKQKYGIQKASSVVYSFGPLKTLKIDKPIIIYT